MKEVYEFLNNLKLDGLTLVVGVSYGPDSMFLLNLLKEKYPSNKIVCAHVHHNHRKESDKEAENLKKYCHLNNIIFEMYKIKEYKNNKFTEEEARKKRYEFFDSLMKKYNSKYLFTAHHGDDLIETILMKLTRGSSFKGYAGISLISKRNNYSIIRPLLFLTKDDINKYCTQKSIPYEIDQSNLSEDYFRNRYRKYILPRLKKENKNVHKKFIKFSIKLQEYDRFVNSYTNECYDKIVINNVIDIKKLKDQDPLIIDKIIEKYLFMIYKDNISDITSIHKNLILKLIKENKSNDEIDFPNKIKIIKSYNKLYFDNQESYNDYCYLFDKYLKLPNGYVIKQVDKLDDTSNFTTAFNSKEIDLPISIRNKQNGDKIEVLGLKGSKKIKDIFIDEKVDYFNRKNQPVVVSSTGEILWLPGLKKSKYDKSKQGKYDIILKYYKEENNDAK